jgi:SagB-type dehydrogenase family enzyme
MVKRMLLVVSLILFTASLSAEELKSVKLPAPQLDNGKSLVQALKERQSTRSFSTEEIPVSILSNLLWAACGINRPESGKRTAPSAMNSQEIDVYVATHQGLFLYDAKEHALKPVLNQDIRPLTGSQSFVGSAPLNLVYVADLSRMGGADDKDTTFYSATDTGFISQNVYLYCASEGLSTFVRGSINRDSLAKAMKLNSNQKIILAQSVGYPKK